MQAEPSATVAPDLPPEPVEPLPAQAVGPCSCTTAAPPVAGGHVNDVNSWFFVPVLLAGSGLLLAGAATCRRLAGGRVAAPSFSPGASVSVLVCLGRVAACGCLGLQHVAALGGRGVPAAEASLVISLRAAGAALPAHALVCLRWVVESASAQEALLQVFLGERVASGLSVLAGRLRSGARSLIITGGRPAARGAANSCFFFLFFFFFFFFFFLRGAPVRVISRQLLRSPLRCFPQRSARWIFRAAAPRRPSSARA